MNDVVYRKVNKRMIDDDCLIYSLIIDSVLTRIEICWEFNRVYCTLHETKGINHSPVPQ